ncbi:MAG: TIR domain-containing protein [Hyphomonas sp.]|uniref:TIR domain-containing protein n=1 Tax=Hyphomonas sp. TaxID=87 RepID=UPI0032671DF4
MSYRNKTYVIFDGDSDINNYYLMKAWKNNKNIDFDFHDAHELNTLTNRSQEENTKRKLRERFSSAKQAIVLIGESTKNLYQFVRWEIEVCQALDLPIVGANLNGEIDYDASRCPPILKYADAVFVSFRPKIIKHALDNFCGNYSKYKGQGKNWSYNKSVYEGLGL